MNEPTNSAGWQVRIDRPFFADRLHFYLIRYKPGFVEVMQPDGLINRVPEGMPHGDYKPTFELYGMETKAMMIAIAEALELEGVKTPNDHKLQGLLEATKHHLSDMRQLLKLKDKPND